MGVLSVRTRPASIKQCTKQISCSTLEPGELLSGTRGARFQESWRMAFAESFAPVLDPAPDAAVLAAE